MSFFSNLSPRAKLAALGAAVTVGIGGAYATVACTCSTPLFPGTGGCSTSDATGCLTAVASNGTVITDTIAAGTYSAGNIFNCTGDITSPTVNVGTPVTVVNGAGTGPVEWKIDFAPGALVTSGGGVGFFLKSGCGYTHHTATSIDLILACTATTAPGQTGCANALPWGTDPLANPNASGFTSDGIKVAASNLNITGHLDCGNSERPITGAHQDGISWQSGSNVGFYDFTLGDPTGNGYSSDPTATCTGAGGAIFWTQGGGTNPIIARSTIMFCDNGLHAESSWSAANGIIQSLTVQASTPNRGCAIGGQGNHVFSPGQPVFCANIVGWSAAGAITGKPAGGPNVTAC